MLFFNKFYSFASLGKLNGLDILAIMGYNQADTAILKIWLQQSRELI